MGRVVEPVAAEVLRTRRGGLLQRGQDMLVVRAQQSRVEGRGAG